MSTTEKHLGVESSSTRAPLIDSQILARFLRLNKSQLPGDALVCIAWIVSFWQSPLRVRIELDLATKYTRIRRQKPATLFHRVLSLDPLKTLTYFVIKDQACFLVTISIRDMQSALSVRRLGLETIIIPFCIFAPLVLFYTSKQLKY